jgi:ATP-dependent DNA helicase RecG
MNILFTPSERYENKYQEFKLKYSQTVLKVICAFANYHDGSILMGIDDEAQVIGLEDLQATALQIENAIRDNIVPIPYYELIHRERENQSVLEVKVFYGENQPYLLKGIAYTRKDTASVPVDREELKRLIMKGRKLQFDAMAVSEEREPKFTTLEAKLRERIGIETLDENVLKTLGVIQNDAYTHAALLLSDDPQMENATIELVRFVSSNVSQIMDHQTLKDMSILEQVGRCLDFFEKHRLVQERIEGVYRETVEEVPLVAYREAVANLIVHRDYMHQASARIEIFDDRIEIMSPGGLPAGISEREYVSGNVSIPRNELLANLFLRLGMIEKLATGVKRIKTSYQGRRRLPEFVVRENSITVILPKEHIAKLEREIPLDPIEELIVSYLKVNGSAQRADLEGLIQKGKTTTATILTKMVKRGILIRINGGRSVFYQLR